IKPYATEVEEMLTEGPGVFAGENYDKEKLEAELMKLPSNLTGEKAYQYLIHYLAEDYEPYVKKLDQFDTTYEVGAGPEGTVNQPPEAQQKQINVVVLLDASGSMAGRVDGYTKMTLAKNAILRFADSLPEQAHVSLRVYGHEGSNQKKDKEVSCKSTEQVYPLTPFKKDSFEQSLQKFQPTGYTPIALAIEKAAQDLNGQDGNNNIVYIVSDGIETCGGDPVTAAKSLHTSNIRPIVNIIGFDVDKAGQQALKEVAEAGGGEYATVEDDADLREYFDQQQRELIDAWFDWGIDTSLDLNKQLLEKRDQLEKLAFTGQGILNKMQEKEYDNMDNAVRFMQEKGKITLYEMDVASKLIMNRSDKIDRYLRKRFYEIDEILRDNMFKIDEMITEKSKKEREKLEGE
ncbi:vWA domain-containing protein, partial [Thermoactinomyces mirandus]